MKTKNKIKTKMKTLTTNDKRELLVDAMNMAYKTGHDQTVFVGHPLSYYNYHAVYKFLLALNDENIEQGGDDFMEIYSDRNYMSILA